MKLFSQKSRQRRIAHVLIIHLILPLFFLALYANPVYATDGSLTKNDAYKGLAIALGIVVVAKVMKSVIQDRSSTGPSQAVGGSGGSYGSDEDLRILASAIYGESRGEPFEGQVAVGAVILNRVRSSEFPNTVKEVVYAPGQFTCVSDGQINLTPNETAYRAAKEALAGKDPSKGALFFYNPKTARTLEWLQTRPTTVQIGNHVFAK